MSELRGIRNYITILGYGDIENPIEIVPERQLFVTDVDTDGDSFRYSKIPFAGLPTHETRYRFPLPYPTSSDTTVDTLRELQEEFGELTFAHWKPMKAKYIATEGQVSFYLPRRRRNAASVLSKSETTFPFTCTRNGSTQTVSMVTGSTVTTPASGSCNVARAAKTTGDQKDYVEFRLSACTAGDIVWIQYWPAFLVRVVDAAEGYPGGFRETRDITLLER
jgi:hypothetical protein